MSRSDIPPGTLYLLILKTLSAGPLHGYGIAQHIKRLSVVLFPEQIGGDIRP